MPRSSMMSSGTVARSAQQLLPGAVDGGIGDLLDEGVSLTVEDTVALLDRAATDGLAIWLLPVPGGPRKSASSCLATK